MATCQESASIYVVADSESAELPEKVFQAELEVVNCRRKKLNLPVVDIGAKSTASMVGRELYGLSLSGGGIRSSTFNLGVLQALDRQGEFHRIDYLSTVSGGGYIGSCLSSYWAEDSKEKKEGDSEKSANAFPFRHISGEPESKGFRHLRQYSNYLKPSCPFAGLRLPGLVLRGLCVNALIVLPFLLFLAIATVLIAKDEIRDALGTQQFEYVIDSKQLQQERLSKELAEDDYQGLVINLNSYIQWVFHDKELDVIVSAKPKETNHQGYESVDLENGDLLLKKIHWDTNLKSIFPELTTDNPIQLTIWERHKTWSNQLPKSFNSAFNTWQHWSYPLRKFSPNLFDAWQFKYPTELFSAEDASSKHTLESLTHKYCVIVSGVPKNSYSEKGKFLGDGRWLFEGSQAKNLKLEMFIPPLNSDFHVSIRAWQTIGNGNKYEAKQKDAEIKHYPSAAGVSRNGKLDVAELKQQLNKDLSNYSTWRKEEKSKNYFLWASNTPSHESIEENHRHIYLLSHANKELVFQNDGINHFISHLKEKADLNVLTVKNPMKIVRWVSGEEEMSDPITYLYHNTFEMTKWLVSIMILMLSFYPLLQAIMQKFGLKPWRLRDLMTRYVCGAVFTLVLVVAFLEFQPLIIYLFYRFKESCATVGIFGGADKAVALLGSIIAASGGVFTASSMGLEAKFKAKIAIYAMGLVGPVVLWLFYLNFCGWVVSSDSVPKMFEDVEGFVVCVYFVVGISIYLISRYFYDVNRTSLHPFYRDRLSKAFLIRSDVKTNELQHNDEQKLQGINSGYGPYHILNATLNITGKSKADIKGRKADFFSFSREYVGSRVTGYARTADYEALDNHLGLGTAMAISAAAVAPNMGRETNRSVTFILALFNMRLGYWARNPRLLDPKLNNSFWRRLSNLIWPDQVGPTYLAKEMVGLVNEKSAYINLSDGGHIENMGLYELVRRRCKYIIVCDAEEDKNMTCHGFADAIRMVLIDMGIKIYIDLDDIYRKEKKGDGSFKVVGDSHYAVGTIQYGKGEEEKGYLLYIKSSVSQKHAPYINDYMARHPDFPQETTADQIFNEAQFEAYRALGWEIGEKVMEKLESLPEMTTEQSEAIMKDKKLWKEQAQMQWGMWLNREHFI